MAKQDDEACEASVRKRVEDETLLLIVIADTANMEDRCILCDSIS